MDAGFWTVLAGVKDTATLVLILALLGLGWLYVKTIGEHRLDRKELTEVIAKNTEALNSIRNFLSAMTGKPLQ